MTGHSGDLEDVPGRRHTYFLEILTTVTEGWGVTLRVALLVCIPAAVVVLLALILGSTGLGAALVTAGAAGNGRWLLRRRPARHRRR